MLGDYGNRYPESMAHLLSEMPKFEHLKMKEPQIHNTEESVTSEIEERTVSKGNGCTANIDRSLSGSLSRSTIHICRYSRVGSAIQIPKDGLRSLPTGW